MGLGNWYYPLYPAICIIGCVLMLLPLPWHIRARNTGTLMYFFWSFGANLQAAINHILWSGFLHNKYPLWCDISAKFQVGVTTGIGASILVVNRRLYKIANISTVLVSAKQKRRDLFIDLGIGLGLPLLVMVLHVIVQGHRYNIIEGMGCQQTTYHTPPAYFLVWLWPPVVSLVSAGYVILALRLFLKRRNSFDEFLNSNNSGLNVDRYLRLMLFSAFELIVSFPLNVYMILEQAINHQIFPWISWEDTHWGFNRADLIPFFFIRRSRTLWISYNVYVWVIPFTAFCFFGFFGFGKEQRKNYVKTFWLIMSYVGIKRPEPTPYNSGRPLPWWKRMLGFKSSGVNTAGTGISSATDSLPRFAKAGVVSHTSNPISSLDKPTRRVRRDSMDSLDAELDRMAQRDNQLLDEKAITKKFNPSASSSSSVDYNEKDDGGSSCGSSVDESHDRVVRAVPEPRAPPRALDPRDIV